MTIDFFVHPEFNNESIGRGIDGEIYGDYIRNLSSVLESSRFPILINGLMPDKSFAERIPKGNHLESSSYWNCEFPVFKGEVSADCWEKFTGLISGREKEEMKIHGSNFGECTEGFAVQLFAYIYRNEHWNNWTFYPSYDGRDSDSEREKTLMMEHERSGDFTASKIRYGVVFNHPLTKVKIKSKPSDIFARFLSKFPRGNITYQLIGEETRIYSLAK